MCELFFHSVKMVDLLPPLPTFGAPGTIYFEADEPTDLRDLEPSPFLPAPPTPKQLEGLSGAPEPPLEAETINFNPTIDRQQVQWTGPLVIGNARDVYDLAMRTTDFTQFYAALTRRYQNTAPLVIGGNQMLTQFLDAFYVTGGESEPDEIRIR